MFYFYNFSLLTKSKKMNSLIRPSVILSILLCFFLTFLNAQIDFPTNSATEPTISTSPITEIVFDALEYDFGTITSGEKITHVYTFTNTGDAPLVLSNAKGSCGCTVPSWPREPILPGEQGTIEVTFDSTNKSGAQSKRVTLTANTNPAQTFLTIRGQLTKPEEEEESEDSAIMPIEKINAKQKVDSKNCFAVFPNPTTDVLKLELNENIGKSAMIRIYSPQGQLMVEKAVDKIVGTLEFDVSSYTKGTYIANVQIDGGLPTAMCFVVL